MNISKPSIDECAKFYNTYIELVNEPELLLNSQIEKLKSLIGHLTEEELLYKYSSDKWSIKTLIVHCIDTERIMAYRLLSIIRTEKSNLPGFDENVFADESFADIRSISSIMNEFQYLRMSNIELIKSLSTEQLEMVGSANNNIVSARALVYIIVGHLEHHMNILISRYLNK
jgi:hypothetical protein